MQDVPPPDGNIKASPELLRTPLVRQMRRERLQGLIHAIDAVKADPGLSDFQKEVIVDVLADAIAPETGGVW